MSIRGVQLYVAQQACQVYSSKINKANKHIITSKLKTMNFWRFIIVFVLFFIGNKSVSGQELTQEELKEVEEKYYGNMDYFKGDKAYFQGDLDLSRSLYLSAADSFALKEQWEGYIEVMLYFTKSYLSDENYQIGIDQSIASMETIEQNAPEIYGKCEQFCEVIGKIYGQTYQNQKAAEYFSLQLNILKKYYPENTTSRFANAYNNIGKNFLFLGQKEDAKINLQKALEIILASKEEDTLEKAKNALSAYGNLAEIHKQEGDYEKALDAVYKGIDIGIKAYGKHDKILVYPYQIVASIYSLLVEPRSTKVYLKKAIDVIQNAEVTELWLTNQMLPYLYLTIGVANLNLNEPQKAIVHFDKAIAILTKIDEITPLYFAAIIGKGNALHLNKSYKKALTQFELSDSIFLDLRKNGKTDHVSYQTLYHQSLRTRGALWNDQNDLAKAKQFYLESIKKENSSPQGLQLFILSNMDIAALHEKKVELDSALLYSNAAFWKSCIKCDSIDNSNLPPASALINFEHTYNILAQRASIFNKLGSQATNQEERFKFYKKAMEMIDLADQFHDDNLKKINLLRNGSSKHLISGSELSLRKSLEIVWEQNINPDKGFYFTQKMKSQKLWMTLLKSEATSYGNLSKDLLEKEKHLTEEINHYENLLHIAASQNDTANIDLYENKYLFELKRDYIDLQNYLENQFPNYYASKYQFIPVNPESLQEVLEKNELLIEYIFTDSSIFTFTIAQNSPLQLKQIKFDPQIIQCIDDCKSLLSNSTMSRPSSREKFINLSHQLYQQFLHPIEDQLKGKKRLIIIGDGMTNYIPFETLLATKEIKPFKDLDFLVKNHEISYHYSSTLFAKAKRKEMTKNEGVFAFAPVYDNGVNMIAVSLRNYDDVTAIDSTLRAYTPDGFFAPLPESENEAKSIVHLFEKQNTNATLALRENATEKNLKTNLEQPYRFLHIAGHSFADLENPKFSGIACFQEENIDSTSTNDGTLFTGEIYNISSQADLVTLSSCESGFGKLEKTEGLLGLNRAFIYAGTPNVVFSLWKVYDKVSANLMVDFYKSVLEGKDYSASLREAKLKLLDNEATAAPHFWSPFLLIGR